MTIISQLYISHAYKNYSSKCTQTASIHTLNIQPICTDEPVRRRKWSSHHFVYKFPELSNFGHAVSAPNVHACGSLSGNNVLDDCIAIQWYIVGQFTYSSALSLKAWLKWDTMGRSCGFPSKPLSTFFSQLFFILWKHHTWGWPCVITRRLKNIAPACGDWGWYVSPSVKWHQPVRGRMLDNMTQTFLAGLAQGYLISIRFQLPLQFHKLYSHWTQNNTVPRSQSSIIRSIYQFDCAREPVLQWKLIPATPLKCPQVPVVAGYVLPPLATGRTWITIFIKVDFRRQNWTTSWFNSVTAA